MSRLITYISTYGNKCTNEKGGIPIEVGAEGSYIGQHAVAVLPDIDVEFVGMRPAENLFQFNCLFFLHKFTSGHVTMWNGYDFLIN